MDALRRRIRLIEITEEPLALDSALDLLHEASRIPAKSRTVKVSALVDVICRHALDHGLDEEPLRDVVQLVSVKTALDQSSVTTLIKNLYPAQHVPKDVIVTVVGALGQGKGKPTLGTQDSLVKWLILVHEIIQGSNVLSRLYSVLFGMLDMISIRTSLCYLLSLITRRKHVKPFRIQQLLELSRGLGNEPALQGLLRVYKDYYPDIILGSTSTSRKSFTPQPDEEWRTRIAAVKEASVTAEEHAADRYNGFKVSRKGPRRGKSSAIPEVHTYQTTETSVTLEGIDNVEDFVERLDTIEPPGQLVSLLTDPLLQKFVDLKPTPITTARIGLWLATCLEDQYEGERIGSGDPQYLAEVLQGLLQHTQYTKTLHPIVLAFLGGYIPIWNGADNVDTVLGLLAFLPITSFGDAYNAYIAPAEQSLSSHGIAAYTKMIDFYTSVLQHQVSQASSQQTRSNNTIKQVVKDLTTHVATLSTSVLLSTPHRLRSALTSSVLSFYELLSSSSQSQSNAQPMIPITLPPTHLIYLLAEDTSLTTLSRICGILGAYKNAFDAHPKPISRYYPEEVTSTFNTCLRDMYNILWVSKGLFAAEGKSVGLYCAPELRSQLHEYLRSIDRSYTIETAFGLSYNAWTSSVSAVVWRALESSRIERQGLDASHIKRDIGPITKVTLDRLKEAGGVSVEWDGPDGYKVHVLRYLDERGLGGMKDLMFAIATNLRGKA
ncbi:hypothetical protein NX059_001571 [Plenodomus lindquistii]|nr:hypothetical protein NX059_001571 [Plenodomus lindquistii]